MRFKKSIFLQQAVEILPKDLADVRSCLVLAPHPDDESLGCGGLICLLRDKLVNVSVVLTTDGSQSHPNSKTFPPEKVALIRKREVTNALQILQVGENHITFLGAKDAALPSKDQPGFDALLLELVSIIKELQPQLILVPYQLDPHCDHRATWQLLNEALKSYGPVKVWEYPIWLYELAEKQDIPKLAAGELKKINIEKYLDTKISAIASHISQTTNMINDDPTGFILTEDVIGHFTTEFEYFIERT